MNNNIGKEIIEKITTFNKKVVLAEEKASIEGREFTVRGDEFLLEILINPPKWLGLKFYLLDEKGKILLTHDIDTDLYDLSQPKYQSFTKGIETDMIDFIDSIINGSIKVGKIKDRPAMIVPQDNKFLLIKKGKFFTSSETHKDLSKIDSNESFRELKDVTKISSEK